MVVPRATRLHTGNFIFSFPISAILLRSILTTAGKSFNLHHSLTSCNYRIILVGILGVHLDVNYGILLFFSVLTW